MNEITIDGVDINVNQTITGIKLSNPKSMEIQADGIKWNGRVTLLSNGSPLGNMRINRAINSDIVMSFDELNATGQSLYSKDYVDLTVTESFIVQGQTLATKLIAEVTTADVGITIEDITALVTRIVQATSV